MKGGLKEMNKTFVLTTLIGVFVLNVLSVSVLAVDQGINATISEDITVIITPETITFGTVAPGSIDNVATNGPIEFDATGSNDDVHIEVTAVSGFPFDDGLMLDATPALGQFWDLLCTPISDVCTFSVESTIPTLDVPAGAPAGNAAGTITYTITGPPAP
jgi:hypothetical protein